MSTNSGGDQSPAAPASGPTPSAGELAVPQAVADLQEYLCIEYPGIVKNVDKALETLGGFEKVQAANAEQKRWLSLNFRPNNSFSRPVEGERVATTKMILKLRISDNGSASGQFVGIAPSVYRFRGLSDYQYVPKHSFQNETCEPRLQSEEIPQADSREALEGMHLPPTGVTIIDMPVSYNYQPNTLFAVDTVPIVDVTGKVIGEEKKFTKKKDIQAKLIDGEVKRVAKPIVLREPHMIEGIADIVPSQPFKQPTPEELPLMPILRRLFEERPIWTRPVLTPNIPDEFKATFKYLLPAFAYVFVSGPWRNCWVRLGYDPRDDPSSRMYQVVDFRVLPDQTRGTSTSYWGKNKFKPRRTAAVTSIGQLEPSDTPTTEQISERPHVHAFTAPPTQRHTIYQLVDIEIPEVQRLVAKKNANYDKLHGWLPSKVMEQIRDLMKKRLIELLKAYDEGALLAEEEEEVEGSIQRRPTTTADDAMDVDMPNQTTSAPAHAPQQADEEDEEEEEEEEEDAEEEEEAADVAELGATDVSRVIFGAGGASVPTDVGLDEEPLQMLQSLVDSIDTRKSGRVAPDESTPTENPSNLMMVDDGAIEAYNIFGDDDDNVDDGYY